MHTQPAIQSIINQSHEKWIEARRFLHRFAELSGEEHHTAVYIAETLGQLGLEVTTGLGGYGVRADMKGSQPGPLIAYRADMDALPIQDTRETPYAPLELGIKHACGHDVHMAIALGTAEVLASLRDNIHGTLSFIFQPAEESLDGAQAMLDDGLFQDEIPEAILALHAFPLPVGTIALRKGIALAGMQEWRVRLYAPAGNLAAVQQATIQAVEALNSITQPLTTVDFDDLFPRMRTSDCFSDAQFISAWESGYTSNDPWHVMILASLTDFNTREDLHTHLATALTQACAEHGASFDLHCAFENPPLVNNALLIDQVRIVGESLLGPANVWQFQTPYPFAHEDFALYSAYAPTAFIWLGTANRDAGINSILHTPDYDVDERAIGTGVELMANLLLNISGSNDIPE